MASIVTSNVVVGRAGDCWETRGTWTGGIGDSAGTIKVPGSQVFRVDLNPNLASGGPSMPVAWSSSGTLPVTVTVGPYNLSVTGGTFSILSR